MSASLRGLTRSDLLLIEEALEDINSDGHLRVEMQLDKLHTKIRRALDSIPPPGRKFRRPPPKGARMLHRS